MFPGKFLRSRNSGVAEIFQRLHTAGIINHEPREKNKEEDPTYEAARVSMYNDKMVTLLSVRYSQENLVKLKTCVVNFRAVRVPFEVSRSTSKTLGGSSNGFTAHKALQRRQGGSSLPPDRGVRRKGQPLH